MRSRRPADAGGETAAAKASFGPIRPGLLKEAHSNSACTYRKTPSRAGARQQATGGLKKYVEKS